MSLVLIDVEGLGSCASSLVVMRELTVRTPLVHFSGEGHLGPPDIVSNPWSTQEVSHAAGQRMSRHLINPH